MERHFSGVVRDSWAFVLSQVPKSEGVKCTDILYSLSPDILYTCCQPVKRRQALLESNLAEE